MGFAAFTSEQFPRNYSDINLYDACENCTFVITAVSPSGKLVKCTRIENNRQNHDMV